MTELREAKRQWVAAAGEESLRAAIPTLLLAGAPTLGLAGIVWTQIARPGAIQTSLTLIGSAALLLGLALYWRRHPPRRAHLAGTFGVCVLHVCSMQQMIALGDPSIGALYLIVAIATTLLLVDLRWMVFAHGFGVATWLFAMTRAPSQPDWTTQIYVVALSLGAVVALRAGRVRALERLAATTLEAERQAEILRRSDNVLRAAQRIANVGSFEWTLESGDLRWSEEHYRIFGFDPDGEPTTNQRFIDAVHPEDRARVVDALARSLRGDGNVSLTYRILRPDGEERVLQGRSETRFDASGKPTSHVGTSLDITEMHHTEAALRDSEERNSALLNAMDLDRAVVIERDGLLQSLLGETRHTGRYGPILGEEIPGRHVRDFLPGDAAAPILGAVERIFETGEPEEVEVQVDFPTGTFYFDCSLRALRDVAGEVAAVLGLIRDVTTRKESEQALQQTQKLESLGILAGGIAHDFNNLLVGIVGNSEAALERERSGASVRRELEGILRAAERAGDLTHQLLAYAGEASFSRSVVDLCELVGEMAQLMRASLSGGARLEIDAAAEPVWIDADLTQIRQLVMNFVTNASEALGDSPGHVWIRTGSTELEKAYLDDCYIRDGVESGPYAFLEVADEGSGMDRETLERIFDPFFTTKFQGRGLGLAATLGIIRAHAGTIRVVSEPGRGTTMTVLLPRAAPPSVAAEEERQPEESPSASSMRVLVVDDEEVVRTATTRMLEAEGYEVVDASDGGAAIERVREQPDGIDLVMLDLTMPGLSGSETLVELRRIRPDLPVVLMTGRAPGGVGRNLDRATVLAKPFRLADIHRAIRAVTEPSG